MELLEKLRRQGAANLGRQVELGGRREELEGRLARRGRLADLLPELARGGKKDSKARAVSLSLSLQANPIPPQQAPSQSL